MTHYRTGRAHWSDEDTVLTVAARVFAWIFGVFMVLVGITSLSLSEHAPGVGYILTGLVAMPVVRRFIAARTGWELTGGVAVLWVVAMLFLTGLMQVRGCSIGEQVSAVSSIR